MSKLGALCHWEDSHVFTSHPWGRWNHHKPQQTWLMAIAIHLPRNSQHLGFWFPPPKKSDAEILIAQVGESQCEDEQPSSISGPLVLRLVGPRGWGMRFCPRSYKDRQWFVCFFCGSLKVIFHLQGLVLMLFFPVFVLVHAINMDQNGEFSMAMLLYRSVWVNCGLFFSVFPVDQSMKVWKFRSMVEVGDWLF